MDSITEETATSIVTAVRLWLTEQVAKALPDIIDEKVEVALTKSNTEAAIERGIRCALEDSSIDLGDVLNRIVTMDLRETVRDAVAHEVDNTDIEDKVGDAVNDEVEKIDLEDLIKDNVDLECVVRDNVDLDNLLKNNVDLEDLIKENVDFDQLVEDAVQECVERTLQTRKDDIQQQITESVKNFAASAIYEQVSLAAKTVVEKETSGVHIAVKAAAEKAAKAHVEKTIEDGPDKRTIAEAVRLAVTEVLPQHVEICVEQRLSNEFRSLRSLVGLIKSVRSFVVNEWQD